MGLGPTATVGFLDSDGEWVPVSADNPLPTAVVEVPVEDEEEEI